MPRWVLQPIQGDTGSEGHGQQDNHQSDGVDAQQALLKSGDVSCQHSILSHWAAFVLSPNSAAFLQSAQAPFKSPKSFLVRPRLL